MISTAGKASAHVGLSSAFTHSMLLLLLLLMPNVFISVCHGRPAASRRHSDVISDDDDDDDEPHVYAVFERNDHVSGKITHNDGVDSFGADFRFNIIINTDSRT